MSVIAKVVNVQIGESRNWKKIIKILKINMDSDSEAGYEYANFGEKDGGDEDED